MVLHKKTMPRGDELRIAGNEKAAHFWVRGFFRPHAK